MANSVLNLIEKHAGGDFVPRVKQFLFGLAEDFWKDAPFDPALFGWLPAGLKKHLFGDRPAATALTPARPKEPARAKPFTPAAVPHPAIPLWHAAPGEVAEKMWGSGYVLPAGEAVIDLLTKPLGLKKDRNLLDLAAGLGGGSRLLASKVNMLNGFETDAALAARGTELSTVGNLKQAPIEAYDPATFAQPPTYDAAIARELFYRVADKPAFFGAIAGCLKQGGQMAFTDYIVDPENRQKPAIIAWQAHEKGAAPLGLIEMAQAWAKAGFEMRASDDETAFYKREVINGLQRLVAFLGSGGKPDRVTKREILREVELWVHRIAAIEQGMKFYRFHAARQG